MKITDKRKINKGANNRIITEYLCNGKWMTLKQVAQAIPANINGEKLTPESLYNRFNKFEGSYKDPKACEPKQTQRERIQAMKDAMNESQESKTQTSKERAEKKHKILAMKPGKYDEFLLNN